MAGVGRTERDIAVATGPALHIPFACETEGGTARLEPREGRVLSADQQIAEMATRQRGLVQREQLYDAGLSDGAIARRVTNGRLHRLYRGVYLVGHPVPPPLAGELAAVLSCGKGAVISHRTAANLWSLLPDAVGVIHVTVAGRNRRHRNGIRIHRVKEHPPSTRLEGIPITTPARTLHDVAPSLTDRALERAIDEALVRNLARESQLRRSPRLAAFLARQAGPTLTRSEAEERMLALIRDARLPQPRMNHRVGAFVLDFFWPEQSLALEVDGYRVHRMRSRFESDSARSADLHAIGIRLTRVTWRQITTEPLVVAARLSAALALG